MKSRLGSSDADDGQIRPDGHEHPRHQDEFGLRQTRIPSTFQTAGRAAWLFVGMALAIVITFAFFGLISNLLIPLLFATILAAIFVPAVDRLEKLRVPRLLGAPIVVIFAIAIVAVVIVTVIEGVIGVGGDLMDKVADGLAEAQSMAGTSEPDVSEARQAAVNVLDLLVTGVISGIGSASALVVAMVTGLFILLYLMKDWRMIVAWTSGLIAKAFGMSSTRVDGIISETVSSFRKYAWGLTIIGLMNAVVVGLGAVLLSVPAAGSIAIVTFVTSYIPFFGAFFAGAFAVVIALGANGLSTALAMLAITLLANNTLQNLIEPITFGKTLDLHPLVVLLVTTAGTLLFGILGATLAAPVTAVAFRTSAQITEDTAQADATALPEPET